MRKFNVTVNGSVYEVEVEEVEAGAPAVAAPAAPAAPMAAPKAAPAAPAAPGSTRAESGSGRTGQRGSGQKSPRRCPGTILKINVTVGQKISKGDVVCVLEAMKMENDIPAPQDGTVASVQRSEGRVGQLGRHFDNA